MLGWNDGLQRQEDIFMGFNEVPRWYAIGEKPILLLYSYMTERLSQQQFKQRCTEHHQYVCTYVCMYVCIAITYGKGKDLPGKVANPVRDQLSSENDLFPVPVRA